VDLLRKVVSALVPQGIAVDVFSFPFVDGNGVVGVLG